MKLLRIRVEGLPLYKDTVDLNFTTVQRVESSHSDAVIKLFGNIYVNTVEAFIGINASGKTTALKVITFTNMLLNAFPLNSEFVPKIIGNERAARWDVDFYADGMIYHLQAEIENIQHENGNTTVKIASEELWAKEANSKVNKSNLFSFSEKNRIRTRGKSEEYLSDDVSIMIAVNRQFNFSLPFSNAGMMTDFNVYPPYSGDVPAEVITLLDPTVEYIHTETVNRQITARLKFFGQKELFLKSPAELNVYLSSGTVKGIGLFTEAINMLKNGGYMVVDEIENHFNRELVASLIRLFMDKRTNPKGAVMIFSTHYPELLDEIRRNDAVFITRSKQGLIVDNLNSLLKRNDMKKSDVYQSNFLTGTAPEYKALMALKKTIINGMEV